MKRCVYNGLQGFYHVFVNCNWWLHRSQLQYIRWNITPHVIFMWNMPNVTITLYGQTLVHAGVLLLVVYKRWCPCVTYGMTTQHYRCHLVSHGQTQECYHSNTLQAITPLCDQLESGHMRLGVTLYEANSIKIFWIISLRLHSGPKKVIFSGQANQPQT